MAFVNEVEHLIKGAVSRIPDLEYKHPGYPEIFHNDVHIVNEMWKCPQLRKIHIETGETKHLEVLHCVLYPYPEYNLPIFGCDIVDNGKIITAAIADVSPVTGTRKIYDKLKIVSAQYNDFDDRKLPAWADIFSPYCKFMRLHTLEERDNYKELLLEWLLIYLDEVKTAVIEPELREQRQADQVYYCKKQKMNRKTEGVLSQWFDKEWAHAYIDNILFDEPNELQRVGSGY